MLIMLVWAVLAILRPRNPHLLKVLWTSVVTASLSIPLLMQIHLAPAVVAAPMPGWTVRPVGATLAHAVSASALGTFTYLMPTLFLLGRYAAGFVRLWFIRREGRQQCAPWADGLDVRTSAKIQSPATFGTTILLPVESSTWSKSKLDAVVAHERAHVLHRDCYALWLARLHACVFWFNPLAWWVARRLAALAEQTSDEAAIQSVGNRIEYAEILLGLGMERSSELATAMASSPLSARIERILSGITLSPALRRSQLALAVAAVLPALALAAAPVRLMAAQTVDDAQFSAPINGTAPAVPRVVSWGPLDSYYPPEAMRKGIEGIVELAITLDGDGRATDTQVLTEDPLQMGFGAAASAAAHAMVYSNPTGHPVTFSVRVKFALSPPP
jgi:TonB family protein